MSTHKNPHCIELICSVTTRGTGVEADPYRKVIQIHSKEGDLMAEWDPALKDLLRSFVDEMTGQRKMDLERIIQDLP